MQELWIILYWCITSLHFPGKNNHLWGGGGGGGDIRRPFPVVLVKLAFNATRNSPFSMKKCSKMPVFLKNA